jgi:hypothetical protein
MIACDACCVKMRLLSIINPIDSNNFAAKFGACIQGAGIER